MENPALELFDGHLRSALIRITNTSLSDTQWLQASLPIKHGSWHFPPFWLEPRAPRISSRRFCWHQPAPLTPTLIRTSQTGRGHMVPCLLQTLCRSSSRFGTNQVFCPPVQSARSGSAVETASVGKETKYTSLPPDYIFQPVAIETLGPLNASSLNFLSEVGRRLTSLSGDSR